MSLMKVIYPPRSLVDEVGGKTKDCGVQGHFISGENILTVLYRENPPRDHPKRG
jgi:hypothetical protein